MSHFELLLDPHSSAQRDYSYDSYIDNVMGVEVHDECVSFKEFKLKNIHVVMPPASSKTYAFNYPIKAHAVVMEYNCPVTPDPTKKFILSLITGVEREMDDQKCYAPFTAQNIVVTREGHALFKHLAMVRLSDDAKRAAYQSTANVISDLYEGFHMPADIQHLIGLLNSGKKQVIYKIHPSLLPHTERGWMYLKAYEYLMHRANGASKDLILLSLPYISNWRTIVNLNHVLIETYEFCPISYNEEPSLDKNGNPTTWSEIAKNLQSAERFLEFIRNGISHRMQRSFRITADQHETILLVLFHMLLPKLLEAMFDHLGVDGLKKAGLLR